MADVQWELAAVPARPLLVAAEVAKPLGAGDLETLRRSAAAG
jgi:hypothetical protein